MAEYQRVVYEKTFARLLNKALKKGGNDPALALAWLDKKYRLLFVLLSTPYRLESTDAYMDVREHLQKRIAIQQNKGGGEN